MMRWGLIILVPAAVIVSVYWLVFRGEPASAPSSETPSQAISEPEEPPYKTPDLQPAVDAWVAKYSADYHIAVWDAQAKELIGLNNPDEPLFAASLYKIYVAYLALVDFQKGVQDPNEVLIYGQTRRECVDKMIRSSDSPCGEAMMADMGQLALNERVHEMGMTATKFNGIETSAHDSALILQYIIEKRDLNDENTAFLLDAMEKQDAMYRRGLAAGAPEAKWETKVGWNLDINYHDIGIMTTPDGRRFAVAILGQGSGSPAPIADFAATIYSELKSSL